MRVYGIDSSIIALFALIVCIVIIVGMWTSYQEYFNPPGGPLERYHSLSETAAKKVAIINVSGAILEGDGFIKRQIDRARLHVKVGPLTSAR